MLPRFEIIHLNTKFLKIHEDGKTMKKKADKDRSQKKQSNIKIISNLENTTEDKDTFRYIVYEDASK